MEQEGPQFLARKSPSHRSLGQVLAEIWETDSTFQAIGLHGSLPWPKDRRSAPGVLLSALLHFAVLLFLVRLPVARLLVKPNTPPEQHTEHLVYMLHPLAFLGHLPTLKPPGPGGKPGQGNRPNRPPARGGQAFHPTLTIISNPPHPDNDRQTIVQASSPPQLKLPNEIRLPNILIGNVAPPPPAPRPTPPAPKPIETHFVLPPRPPVTPPPAPQLALVAPSNPLANPALPVPLPPAPAPPATPQTAPQPAPQPQTSEAVAATTIDELDTRKSSAATAGLLSLSIDPAPPTGSVTLPPGNRQGAFSISPAGGKDGSPGGIPAGDAQGGGSGGNGLAGDASAGLGSGNKVGGGGGADASPAPGANVSITDSHGGNDDGTLPSFFGATSVVPVSPPLPRGPMMVVTTGPTGGGGLRVYGVLKGKKIYTVYLPMPDRNWILQYCARDNSGPLQDRERRKVEITLEVPVAPPAAVAQFDFRRPPLPDSGARQTQTIILQGVIQEDGSVGELKVYKGAGGLDRAALAAFSHWKFRPAQRSSKPIAVEILVGIPVVVLIK